MHGLETLMRLNNAERPEPHPLRLHPRIRALRRQIGGMAVGGEYLAWLRHCLYKYADQIVARPHYSPGEGWDDLEALQQLALGEMMEASLREMIAPDPLDEPS
jgi:hypothetical protein